MTPRQHLSRVRAWLTVFVIGLVLSGITAFPLVTEVTLLHRAAETLGITNEWLDRVHEGIVATDANYPFLAYGTDWLAFAHLVIAAAFLGPLRDPVRNVWIVQGGMISCVAIVPLAVIAGPVRGIPGWWTLIDISFGVFGIIPLLAAYRHIKALTEASPAPA